MGRVLVILPQTDFDPAEVALPWRVLREAGHAVDFASETGRQANCDPVTLSGEGLPVLAKILRARPVVRDVYSALCRDAAFQSPTSWSAVRAEDFGGFLFPGGHAPGMRPYCESIEVARIARGAFARAAPVAAICHGVLPLARAGVLEGRRTTALTARMETLAVGLTERALPGHYRTYPETVEAEVTRLIGPDGRFERGPLLPRFADAASPEVGFVVRDGQYLSARWPGDAWTLAVRLCVLL